MNQKFITMLAALTVSTATLADDILPPQPVPNGACYYQQFTPPIMDEGSVIVVVKEPYTVHDVTPAVFERTTEEVILRDAYTEYVEKPPVFLTETISVPTGSGAYWGVNECENKPGVETYCYTEVSDNGDGTTDVEVVRVIEDSVLDEINHPAEMQTVERFTLIAASTVVTTNVPAETIDLPTNEVTTPGTLEWKFIDCGGASTEPVATLTFQLVVDMQNALNNLGFDAGYADGIVGPKTRAAVLHYKTFNGLPKTVVISTDFMAKLGL